MTALLLNWIRLSVPGTTIVAATNFNTFQDQTPGVWVKSVEGLFEPGASSAEAKARSFSNGSVLNLRQNFSGKVINMTLIVAAPAKVNLLKLQTIMSTPRVSISSDWNATTYTAQFQGDGFKQEFDPATGAFEVSMIFACEEAF